MKYLKILRNPWNDLFQSELNKAKTNSSQQTLQTNPMISDSSPRFEYVGTS